jgi:proteasome lid subunit RPN8/RPN11
MVGEVGQDELLIFADLDVVRDMEAHALSNTRVELGGVMLGHQRIDEQGRPFVVVTDSLRAEHYEATKGSFKFTHETWSQISRQREAFRPGLEMVGWYHTHPGWSVFLSGMDLFICNNFFNRPLDVALVIDPCEQDRGWFQWTHEKTTRRTGGFVLTTGRFRQLELDQFARIYNKEPIMTMDPRYSGNPLVGPQPSVTLMDNRKSGFEIAILGMLMMQFLLVAILAWRIALPAAEVQESANQQRIVELENKLAVMANQQGQTMREEAYREMLKSLVAAQTGDANLVDQYEQMKTDRLRMQANLEGQLALAEQLKAQRNAALNQLTDKTTHAEKLEGQLFAARNNLQESETKLKSLLASTTDDGQLTDVKKPAFGLFTIPWWWLVIGSLVVGLLGSALGYTLGRREDRIGNLTDEGSQNDDADEGFGNPDLAFEDPGNAKAAVGPKRKVSLKIDGNDSNP